MPDQANDDLSTNPKADLIDEPERGQIRRVLNSPRLQYWIAPCLLATALVVFFTWASGNPFNVNAGGVIKNGITYGLLAIGASVVIATGQIDLSSIGVATISGVIFASVVSMGGPDPSLGELVIAVISALAAGFASGAIVALAFFKCRVPLLIFTWALGSIYVLLAILAAGIGDRDGSGVPLPWRSSESFWNIGQTGFVISVVALAVVTAIIIGINLPQRAAALGASETSAQYAGVDRYRTWAECFIINGLLASAAGIMHVLYLGQSSTRDLPGNELLPIAIAVLGGTALSGGYIAIASVISASLFWSCMKLLGPTLSWTLPRLGLVGAEIAQILFYSVFLAISLLFGRALAPPVSKIFARREI